MSVRCRQCDAAMVWDDAVGSAICTSCGSLADPSQTVLTSSQYGNQNDTAEPSLWDPSASTTLKSFRAGHNWDLAGQGKESRDRKNMYAMSDFIKSLAVSFNATGLSPRAITLFTQARSASNFRWGQKSRTVAAACVAIALRESNRPDSIRDIASLLRVPITSVTREFTSITSTLKLSLNLVDASGHISTLHSHLASTLEKQQPIPALSSSLVNSLQAVCLRSAAKTATSLSQLFARLSPSHDILRLPVPPTACGLFMLALEAESRSLLNPLGDLAQFLGTRCHASKTVVMSRYKTVQDEIAIWIQSVPWLDQYEVKGGRSKVSKRLIVARGLKDVIKFQEDIWQKQTRFLLEVDLGSEDDSMENKESVQLNFRPLHKRPKLNQALTQTTHFLMDPLGRSVSSTLSVASKSSGTSFNSTSRLPLATYLLTNSPHALIRRPPTRLQLLAQDRGGAGEEEIADDELFAEGEFEKLLRTEGEIQILKRTCDWTQIEDKVENVQSSSSHRPRKPRAKRTRADEPNSEELYPRKKSRINMEALSEFLAGGHPDLNQTSDEDAATAMLGLEEAVNNYDIDADDFNQDDDEDEDENEPLIVEAPSPPQRRNQYQASAYNNVTDDTADEEVILEEWRSPSPSGTKGMQYEEEYD